MNGWSDDACEKLNEWSKMLEEHAKAHKTLSIRLRRLDMGISGLMIVCSGVSSLLQAVNASGEESDSTLKIAATATAAVATCIAVIQQKLDLRVSRDRHWRTYKQFCQLTMQVNEQLILPEVSRIPLADFLKDMASQRAVLLQNEPQI